MKVLVTGGAGFIGSHVADWLLDGGHEVVVVDDLSTGHRKNVPQGARFYEVDLRAPGLSEVFESERPEVVSHHAAQVNVRVSMTEPMHDAEVNVMGSLNVLRNAVRHGTRKVIYISSGGAVYGEPDYLPADEDHPLRPLSPYGVSKLAVEHYVEMFGRTHDLEYTILRYPNVYGPRQDPFGEAGVVAIFTDQMLRGERCTVYGDGDQARDFVYVADCAVANELALGINGSGRVFNLGWGEPTTVNALFETLAEITGHDQPPVYEDPIPGEVYRTYLDAERIAEELDWRPQVSLEDGLAETVRWVRGERGG